MFEKRRRSRQAKEAVNKAVAEIEFHEALENEKAMHSNNLDVSMHDISQLLDLFRQVTMDGVALHGDEMAKPYLSKAKVMRFVEHNHGLSFYQEAGLDSWGRMTAKTLGTKNGGSFQFGYKLYTGLAHHTDKIHDFKGVDIDDLYKIGPNLYEANDVYDLQLLAHAHTAELPGVALGLRKFLYPKAKINGGLVTTGIGLAYLHCAYAVDAAAVQLEMEAETVALIDLVESSPNSSNI